MGPWDALSLFGLIEKVEILSFHLVVMTLSLFKTFSLFSV